MKKIFIEQGNEFNYKIGDIDDEDIFIDEYNQAALCLEDIVSATINLDAKKLKKESGYLNNIIAFSGERGQGKSSAMHSFAQDVLNINNNRLAKKSSISYGQNTLNSKFVKLESIDPSMFEDMHNVLEVVIARMYSRFERKYKTDNNFITKAHRIEIMDYFQKVYESLSFIRNSKKLEELEYDYESSIQKIAHIGDSARLQKDIMELVDKYLNIFARGNENSFLIIPIDDLDINIDNAYKLSEQIRKYLIVPHVIIIMAVKTEQLKRCIEKEYSKQFANLLKEPHRLHKDEPTLMASKYIEKLIPDGRKISLPEIRTISQSGEDAVFLNFTNKEGQNLLRQYQVIMMNNDYNYNGIEKTLLSYIYDKTGIVFIKQKNSVHPIVPNTLRELVNLLSVLGKMDYIWVNNEKQIKTWLRNIKLFEDYFMYTWMPNNLDKNYNHIIVQLYNKSVLEKHQFVCVSIMEIIDKNNIYTIDEKYPDSITNKKIEGLRKKFSRKNVNYLSYSLGDVMSILESLLARYVNNQIYNFAFAIKTIYTITMHRLISINKPHQNRIESNKDYLEPNNLYKFVGGNLWGLNFNTFIKNVDFQYNPRDITVEQLPETGYFKRDKITEDLATELLNITYISNFPRVDNHKVNPSDYDVIYQGQFIAYNNRYKEVVELSLENLLISPLDFKYMCHKSGLIRFEPIYCDVYTEEISKKVNINMVNQIVVNFELNEHIRNSIAEYDSKTEVHYVDIIYDFINNITKCIMQLDYIKSFNGGKELFLDVEFKNELVNLYVKCLYAKKQDDKLKGGLNRYKSIDDILNKDITRRPDKINIAPKVSNVTRLRENVEDVARSIVYYKNRATFSEDTIKAVRDIYNKCNDALRTGGRSAKISTELRANYKEIANKVQKIIDNC
ncbi:MAG: hypothetical protein FH756_20715 [Firmicutes bacterium]|nr:hypothetical protein [Bacillota bacterium]